MSWQVDLVLMFRSLIGDLDGTKYTDERLKQILTVGAYNVYNEARFPYVYDISVGKVSISPDPISNGNSDFVVLTLYKSACILVGSEVKSESANAISIKDGPSAIDLRGVSGSLSSLYDKLCAKYEDLMTEYQYETGGGFDSDGNGLSAGLAVLTPYSPASANFNTGNSGPRYDFY
jgi:hypothetical protein